MKTGLTPKEKVNLAHDYIYDEHPIGLPHLSQWKVRESVQVPTACTNGKHMTYNPEWIGKLPSNVVKAIVLHELAHVLFGHQLRRGDRDPKLWNIAADLEINGYLVQWYCDLNAYMELREDGIAQGIFPEYGRYKNLPSNRSAEWYYNKLVEQINETPDPNDSDYVAQPVSVDSDDGEGEGEGEGEGDPSDSTGTGAGGDEEGEGEGSSSKSESEQVFQRKMKEFLQEDYELPGFGEVQDAPSLEEDRLEAEETWKETVSQAVVLQKEQGRGFGHEVDVFEELTNQRNKENWKNILSDWVTKRSLGGYTYKRMNRRFAYRKDICLPSNRTKNSTRGAIIVDTSGSMGRSEMDESVRVIDKVCRAFSKAEITLIQCDTRVLDEHIKTLKRHDFPLKVPEKWYGRGGTDMYPAINWVAKRANQFDWCILISDMYWEIMYKPEDVPHTKVPTVYLGINSDPDADLRPPHPQTFYIPVEVAA